MLAMIGMNMIEIKNPRDEELVGWWSEDDDSVDFDDDMEEVFRCESVPNEDSRGEELRSGAKHCTHLITIAMISQTIQCLKTSRPFREVVKYYFADFVR